MSSKETDLRDRRERERQLAANLREARAGRDRLHAMADQEAPEKDDR